MGLITSFHQSDQRYVSLRVVGVFCTLIGAILLVLGTLLLVFGLYSLAVGMTSVPPREAASFVAPPRATVVYLAPWLGGTFSLVWSFGLVLSGLQLVALGTFFRLMIHLEENTRASAQILDKIRLRLESSQDGVEPWFRS